MYRKKLFSKNKTAPPLLNLDKDDAAILNYIYFEIIGCSLRIACKSSKRSISYIG